MSNKDECIFEVFGGASAAQTSDSTQTETRPTTTTVNLNGVLVDQGCYTLKPTGKETSSNPEGKFIRFDGAGNTRVVEMMRSNKDWRNYLEGHKPVNVQPPTAR